MRTLPVRGDWKGYVGNSTAICQSDGKPGPVRPSQTAGMVQLEASPPTHPSHSGLRWQKRTRVSALPTTRASASASRALRGLLQTVMYGFYHARRRKIRPHCCLQNAIQNTQHTHVVYTERYLLPHRRTHGKRQSASWVRSFAGTIWTKKII